MHTLIDAWIGAANAFDTDGFLDYFHPDAVLDDPSVGRKFNGRDGIRRYFVDYFIGYRTQTAIVKLVLAGDEKVHVEVGFKGDFPGNEIGGTFDLTLRDGKIAHLKADLI